ncbi:MAG: hypothetical protein ABSB82_02530 [Terriglobia bacterium]|jgi:hypothetical protein
MSRTRKNGIASPAVWHSAMVADRIMRAEHLKLPSGATILAVKPEPLDWILSGRIPQNLLGAALGVRQPTDSSEADRTMTREEILDLAAFARRLVESSVVEPPIGDGPGEIPMDEIPIRDRAFIFEWACRALSEAPKMENRNSKLEMGQSVPQGGNNRQATREGLSIPQSGMERFREK